MGQELGGYRTYYEPGRSEHTSVEYSSCLTVEAAVDGTETVSFEVPLCQSCCSAVSGIVNNPVRAFNRFDFSFLL